ncbi:hypothetical protein Tco_1331457 [Tanacetum coccineum]
MFTSRAWRRLFDIRGPLVWELILEFLGTLRFGEVLLNLGAPDTIQFQLGGARRRISWRQFIVALGLHTGRRWSLVVLLDTRVRAPEKVTVTNLFYLRRLDVESINISYLLARYLRRFVAGRKIRALISGGKFLPIIDMAELVRLQICMEIDDTWAWVALGPERQPDATAGAPRVDQDAPIMDEGNQAILAPVQAPPPPPVVARTMPQRMVRLEEDMYEIRRALAEQREVIGAMAMDFSRFTVWATSGIAQFLNSARVTYTTYSETCIPYQRRVRQRTGEASTSIA